MKKIILSIAFIIFAFVHCSPVDDPKRNIISFNDNIETVKRALYDLKPILDSLPQIPEELGIGRHYVLQGSDLYIDAHHSISIDNPIIPDIPNKSSKDFIRLILFLQKNYITAATAFYDTTWMFEYRKPKFYNESDDDYRFIILKGNKNDALDLRDSFEILDKKKGLLLVTFKNVRRDNFPSYRVHHSKM